MKEFLAKHQIIIVLGLIIALGAFLRVYHFSDWLHFELDQSRDAIVVDLALDQGIGNLPLLGPKAAGSFLRLGPAFYYFEYASALVFGHTPAGMATHNLLFSILTIPLFYFFVRRYYNLKISLSLVLLFSTSLFMVLYGRFAWNPNSLPFFTLLTFYSLLRAVDATEKRKGWWLVLGAFSLAILTQLHFVAFVGIPAVCFLFLVFKRPRIAWRYWLASLLVILIMYIPPIINDIKTGGENTKEFAKVFAKKTDEGDKNILEKGVRNYTENALGYFLLTTGYEEAELPKLRQKEWVFDIVCDRECRNNLISGGLALLLFSFGGALMLRQTKKIGQEEPNTKKDFMMLVALWFGVTFLLFTPIAYDLAPRFFLVIFALPFIFLGLIFQFLEEKIASKRVFHIVFIFSLVVLLAANLMAVANRFTELSKSKRENVVVEGDKILNEEYRVTFELQNQIVDYMEEIYRTNNFPVYVNSEPFYRRSFLYILDRRGVVRDDFRNTQIAKKIYRHGNYFLVYSRTANLELETAKYEENYAIAAQKEFGTMVVFHLVPREESINAIEQEFGPEKKPRSGSSVPIRCRWNEVFGKCNPDELEDAE